KITTRIGYLWDRHKSSRKWNNGILLKFNYPSLSTFEIDQIKSQEDMRDLVKVRLSNRILIRNMVEDVDIQSATYIEKYGLWSASRRANFLSNGYELYVNN